MCVRACVRACVLFVCLCFFSGHLFFGEKGAGGGGGCSFRYVYDLPDQTTAIGTAYKDEGEMVNETKKGRRD